MKRKVLFISICYLYGLFSAFAQNNSVLSAGDWYKISVNQDGIYKLTYADFNELNINLENLFI